MSDEEKFSSQEGEEGQEDDDVTDDEQTQNTQPAARLDPSPDRPGDRRVRDEERQPGTQLPDARGAVAQRAVDAGRRPPDAADLPPGQVLGRVARSGAAPGSSVDARVIARDLGEGGLDLVNRIRAGQGLSEISEDSTSDDDDDPSRRTRVTRRRYMIPPPINLEDDPGIHAIRAAHEHAERLRDTADEERRQGHVRRLAQRQAMNRAVRAETTTHSGQPLYSRATLDYYRASNNNMVRYAQLLAASGLTRSADAARASVAMIQHALQLMNRINDLLRRRPARGQPGHNEITQNVAELRTELERAVRDDVNWIEVDMLDDVIREAGERVFDMEQRMHAVDNRQRVLTQMHAGLINRLEQQVQANERQLPADEAAMERAMEREYNRQIRAGDMYPEEAFAYEQEAEEEEEDDDDTSAASYGGTDDDEEETPPPQRRKRY